MALQQIGQFTNRESYDGTYTQGRIVKCVYDDVLDSIRVYLYESDGTLVGEQVSGPFLTTLRRSYQDNNYSFCNSGTLSSFYMSETGRNTIDIYPYCARKDVPNHWSCSLVSCDISFNVVATSIVEDSGASDGEITVFASTSYGAPRFSLDQNATFETASIATDNSYTFTGLAAASYTIYAIDENQCRAQLTVIITTQEYNYSTLLRMEFDDVFNRGVYRIDIEEKDYTGSITEVCGGAKPSELSWNGDQYDLFKTIIPSSIDLELLSSSDFQFVSLFTQDERKYRVIRYRDTGAGFNETWRGYLIPSLYSEPYYITSNYIVSITATDQLGDLQYKDFLDDFGNPLNTRISILDAILVILRKTNIKINVWENVNIFAVGMGTTYLNFSNNLFTDTIYPWVNIPTSEGGSDFIWSSDAAYSSSVGYGTPAISQVRPDKNLNWETGSYSVTLNVTYTGAGSGGIYIILCGYDDALGTNEVEFGDIDVLPVGSGSGEYTNVINVTQEKKYLGVKFARFSGFAAFTITIDDFTINTSPTFTTNSSIQQAFINPRIYYNDNGVPQKCDFVLDKLLKSIGSRIYQSDNLWRIELIEQKSESGDYRIFNINGELQSTGTAYSQLDIKLPDTDTFFINRSGLISIHPSYGNFILNIYPFIDNNLLESGEFEEIDIIDDRFKGWTFDLTNGSGISLQYEELSKKRENSLGALRADFSNSVDSGKYVVIKADEFTLDSISGPTLVFSFDVFVRPFYEGFYSYIDYSIKIGDNYVQLGDSPNPGTDSIHLIDSEYIRVYLDDVYTWKEVKKEINSVSIFANEIQELSGPVIVKIRIDNNPIYDFASLAALKAAGTTAYYRTQTKQRALDTDRVRFYEMEFSTEAESSPDILSPDDQGGMGIPDRRWILKKTIAIPDDGEFITNNVLIDNVSLSFDQENAGTVRKQFGRPWSPLFQTVTGIGLFREKITYSSEVNPDIKQDFENDIYHTDAMLDSDDVEDPQDVSLNILRITNNYISLNSGVNTTLWGRSYTQDTPFTVSIEDLDQGSNEGAGDASWCCFIKPGCNPGNWRKQANIMS